MIEQLLANPEQVTFSVLFIAMLVYVIKANDTREKKYQETIKENQEMITGAIKALNGYEEVKENVQKIAEKVGA